MKKQPAKKPPASKKAQPKKKRPEATGELWNPRPLLNYLELFRPSFLKPTPQADARRWTRRLRHIDQNPAMPVLGIRYSDATGILREAKSIQVFDRSTVTVAFGFMQEDHVSFSGIDGAELLNAILAGAAGPELAEAVQADLENIPEKSTGPDAAEPPVINAAKAKLVTYLVKARPERFGLYGTHPSYGEDFYAQLLELVRDPQRDDTEARRMLTLLERTAHLSYAQANRCMKGGAPALAHGYIRAAQLLRDQANEYRNMCAAPQPVESPYPDAATLEDQAATEAPALENLRIVEEPAHALKVGDIVRIKNGEYVNRMARVSATRSTTAGSIEINLGQDPSGPHMTIRADQVEKIG
jgi:hypothetical protein